MNNEERWVSCFGGGSTCADGVPHSPGVPYGDGVIRCWRCESRLRREEPYVRPVISCER